MEFGINLKTWEDDYKKSKIPDKEYPLLIKIISGHLEKGEFYAAKREFTGYNDETTLKSHQGKWVFYTKPVQISARWAYEENAEIIADMSNEL